MTSICLNKAGESCQCGGGLLNRAVSGSWSGFGSVSQAHLSRGRLPAVATGSRNCVGMVEFMEAAQRCCNGLYVEKRNMI